MADKLLRFLFGTFVVRAITRFIIFIGCSLARVANYARARMLFPNAPDVVCAWTTEVKYPQNITLGKRVVLGANCTIGAAAPIYIGDDVLLSKGVFIDTG